MCRGPRQGVPRAFVVMGLRSSRLIIAVKWDSVQPLKSQTSEKCAQLWGADAQCERRVHSSPGHAEQGPRSPWCSRKQRVELRVEKGRDVRGACRWVLESRASLYSPALPAPHFCRRASVVLHDQKEGGGCSFLKAAELGVRTGLGRAEHLIGRALSKCVPERSPRRAPYITFSAAVTR